MMKNLRILAAALLVLSIAVTAQASKLTVYEGTHMSASAPVNCIYVDTKGTQTQILYPAADLTAMVGQPINSITFYYGSGPSVISGGSQRVSIGETSMDQFGGYVTGLTQVATLTMTAGVTELVIDFDTPYVYQGGNLVLETVVEETTAYAQMFFKGVRTEKYLTRTRNAVERFLPMATFDYGIPQDYAVQTDPDGLTFNVRAEHQQVKTVLVTNSGQNPFTLSVAGLNAPFRVDPVTVTLAPSASLSVPVTFAPAVAGDYQAALTLDCSEAGVVEVPLSATALAPVDELTVCDGTDYNANVPIYGLYYDQVGVMGQMIYPTSMISDLAGKKLTSITFYTRNNVWIDGGNIQLSLKVVNNSSFSSETAITGLTAVANVVPVDGGKNLTFEFDEPFEFEGGSLAVEALVTQAGSPGNTYFLGVTRSNNASYAFYDAWGENHETIKFLPKATFCYLREEAGMRGDVNQDTFVNISDVTALINLLLSNDEVPAQADCNLDQLVNITDVTVLIGFLLTETWFE